MWGQVIYEKMGLLTHRRHGKDGFTLLELTTVILIIAILMTMLYAITESLRARAERSKCMANLRGLYSGAASYVMDHGHWPQINPGVLKGDSNEYAHLWIRALRPYGLSEQNWVCPTQQRTLGNPDLTKDDFVRVDYNATPFDTHPYTPYRWSKQPWFVEHASVHDGGALLIYASGQVVTLKDAVGNRSSGP